MPAGYLDIYCERTAPGLWDEPFNAVTNLAFIVAGCLLLAALRRADAAVRRDPAIIGLVTLVFAIGIGSGLFHTFATRWALMADVIPIALFILLYLYLALRRFVALPLWACGLGVAIVLVLTWGMPLGVGIRVSNYAVALAAMVGVGGFLQVARRHPAAPGMLAAAGVFAVSLALRTADHTVCMALATGTHFLWHVLNATVLYMLTRTMMRHGDRASSPA